MKCPAQPLPKDPQLLSHIASAARIIRVGIFLILLVAATSRSNAQTHLDYENALLEYMQITKVYDTQRMSESMHPEALKRFRSVIEVALNGPKKERAAESLLPMFSVSSVDEFERLSDLEAYKRLNDMIVRAAPELVEMMSTSKFEVVGSFVKEDVAYVTYKFEVTMQGKPVSSQVVQTLKVHDGKWRLMLPSTAEASIARIETEFH